MFNPFFNPYRVRRIDQGGIPTLDTIFSNVDTTNNTVYSLGSITQVSNPYDEALPQGQFPIPGQNRRKLVDVFIRGFPKPPMPPMPNVPAPMK